MSAPIAFLSRASEGSLAILAPLDPCDACNTQTCETGYGCPNIIDPALPEEARL